MDALSSSRGSESPRAADELEFQSKTTRGPAAAIAPAQPTASDFLVSFGRLCFCAGLTGFAVLQFIYGDIIPGRPPSWPAGVPGLQSIAYLTGAAMLLVALAFWWRRGLALATAIMIVGVSGWALVRHVPAVSSDVPLGGSWTHAGKALVLVGGFTVFGSLPAQFRNRPLIGILIGRITLGGFMILAGLQHFRWEEFVATLVPAWIPGGSIFWSRASAVLLLAGGTGLLVPRFARCAAALSGLMIFLWFLTLHLPRAFSFQDQNEWTAVFEALAFSGIAFALAGYDRRT